nr:PREDICTED: uncharacterized protein LOC105662741 [Megachile rotundata]
MPLSIWVILRIYNEDAMLVFVLVRSNSYHPPPIHQGRSEIFVIVSFNPPISEPTSGFVLVIMVPPRMRSIGVAKVPIMRMIKKYTNLALASSRITAGISRDCFISFGRNFGLPMTSARGNPYINRVSPRR